MVSSTIFKVFGMTRPGIEPRSPGPLANMCHILPEGLGKYGYKELVEEGLGKYGYKELVEENGTYGAAVVL